MADYWDQQPFFTNPNYASDKQKAAQQAYADALMKRAGEGVTRPTGALGAMIDQLTSNIYRNATQKQEQGQYGQDLSNLSPMIAALQGGGQPPAPQGGPPASSPAASGPPPTPNTPANVDGAIASQTNYDGSPRVLSMNGSVPVQPGSPAAGGSPPPAGAPVPPPSPVAAGAAAPTFEQRYNPVAQLLLSPQISGEQKSYIQGLLPKQAEDLTGRRTITGPLTPERLQGAGPGVVQGVRTPASISPDGISGAVSTPAPGYGAPSGPAVGGTGNAMDTMNTLRLNSAGSGAVADIKKADIVAANDAPTIKRVAGIMLDDLNRHGDKMTFGPTAEWSNNIKRVAANYAPGAMKDQLDSIASADSFDKMSAQLTSLLAKGGGTDAQLFNNMKSVPGAHNSKEGAEALLKMTLQVADQSQALRNAVAAARTPEEYTALKDKFYKENPIINPLTSNPIALDLQKNKSAGGARILSVESPK